MWNFSKAILLAFIFNCCSATIGKSQSVDSLLRIVHNDAIAVDDRLVTYDVLAWDVYMYYKPDSAYYYGGELAVLAKQHNKLFQEANGYSIQAVAMKILGNYPRALELQDYCFKVHSQLENSSDSLSHIRGIAGKSSAVGNKGNIYRNMGDYEQALKCYRESMKYTEQLKKELGDKSTPRQKMAIANGHINMGACYIYQKKWDEAFTSNSKALELFIELKDENAQSSAYRNLGMIADSRGDFASSLAYYEKCLSLRRNEKDKTHLASVYNSLAVVYFKMGEYDKSLEWNLKSLEIAKELKAPIAIRDASETCYHIYRQKGDWEKANSYLSDAISINDKMLEINFPILSEKEKEMLFSMMFPEYASLYSYAFFRKDQEPQLIGRVYSALTRNKGMMLRSTSALSHAINSSDNDTLKLKYAQWLDKRSAMAEQYNNNENTAKAEEEVNQLEKELVQLSAAFMEFDNRDQYQWQQVQKRLSPGEVAIEFMSYRDRYLDQEQDQYMALVIRHDSKFPEMVQLCNELQLMDALNTGGADFDRVKGVYGTQSSGTSALYDLIWKPLEQHLHHSKTIFYSPEGLLHKVSFAALRDPSGIWLSKKYQLRCVSNTTTIKQHADPSLSKGKALLYGGIEYGMSTSSKAVWNYLPGTKAEAQSLTRIFRSKKYPVDYYDSTRANESVFKSLSTQSTLIHLATHGFFYPDPAMYYAEQKAETEVQEDLSFRGAKANAEFKFMLNANPLMRSGIVLAGANKVWQEELAPGEEDGVLTALEISSLDLRKAQLVVLSACETGLGDIRGKDGVYGLQRAFKMAGVQYMMLSLWEVPDKETAEFMELFYANLLKSKNIQDAFNKTQHKMQQKYDPYFWAAFVLLY